MALKQQFFIFFTHDYDYISYGDVYYDYDNIRSCNRLKSIIDTDYWYDCSNFTGIRWRHLWSAKINVKTNSPSSRAVSVAVLFKFSFIIILAV